MACDTDETIESTEYSEDGRYMIYEAVISTTSAEEPDMFMLKGHLETGDEFMAKVSWHSLDKHSFAIHYKQKSSEKGMYRYLEAFTDFVTKHPVGSARARSAMNTRLDVLLKRAKDEDAKVDEHAAMKKRVDATLRLEIEAQSEGRPAPTEPVSDLMPELVGEPDSEGEDEDFVVLSPVPPRKKKKKKKSPPPSDEEADDDSAVQADDISRFDVSASVSPTKKRRGWTKYRLFPAWKNVEGHIGQFMPAEGRFGQRTINQQVSDVIKELTLMEPNTDVPPFITFWVDPELSLVDACELYRNDIYSFKKIVMRITGGQHQWHGMHAAWQQSALVKAACTKVGHIPYLFPDEETALRYTAQMVNEHQDTQSLHTSTNNIQNFKTSRCVLEANGITPQTDIRKISTSIKKQLCVINKLKSSGDLRNVYAVISAINTPPAEYSLLKTVFGLAMKHMLRDMPRWVEKQRKSSAKKSGKKMKPLDKMAPGDIPKNFITKELYSGLTMRFRKHVLRALADGKGSLAQVTLLHGRKLFHTQ